MKDYVNTPKPPVPPPKRIICEDVVMPPKVLSAGATAVLCFLGVYSASTSLGVLALHQFSSCTVGSNEIAIGIGSFAVLCISTSILWRYMK